MPLPVLTRFIHRRHWLPTRLALGLGAAALGAVVTGRAPLVRELLHRFVHDDDVSLGLRRLAYYLRRRMPGISLLQRDRAFDPSLKLSDPELAALERFVTRTCHADSFDFAADTAFVAARRLTLTKEPSERETARTAYLTAANRLLAKGPSPAQIDANIAALSSSSASSKSSEDLDLEAARSALTDFAAAVPLDTWRWFVVSGTFLGLIREGGFLAHDYDIDLGIMADGCDLDTLLGLLRDSPDFALRRVDASAVWGPDGVTPPRPALVKLLHRSGLKLDLFMHYVEGNGEIIWHGSSLHQWINSAFELADYELEGIRVLGPRDPDRYLTENYGDWHTPVPDFNCTVDTGNGRILNHPSAVTHFMRKASAQGDSTSAATLKLWQLLVSQHIICSNAGKINAFETHPDLFIFKAESAI